VLGVKKKSLWSLALKDPGALSEAEIAWVRHNKYFRYEMCDVQCERLLLSNSVSSGEISPEEAQARQDAWGQWADDGRCSCPDCLLGENPRAVPIPRCLVLPPCPWFDGNGKRILASSRHVPQHEWKEFQRRRSHLQYHARTFYRRSGARCSACGADFHDLHHIVGIKEFLALYGPRGLEMSYQAANLMPLCSLCHTKINSNQFWRIPTRVAALQNAWVDFFGPPMSLPRSPGCYRLISEGAA